MKVRALKHTVLIVLLIVPVFAIHLLGLQWSANSQAVQEDPFPQPVRIEMGVEKAIWYHDPTIKSKISTSEVTTFYQSEQAWYQEVREETDDENKVPVLIQRTWNGALFQRLMQFDKRAVQARFGEKAATLKPTYSASEKLPEHFVRTNPLAHVFQSLVKASMNPVPSANPDIEQYELVVVDSDFVATNRGVMKKSTTLKGNPIVSLELFSEDTKLYSFKTKDYNIEWNGYRLPEVIEEQYINRANTITITYSIQEIAPLDQFDLAPYAIVPDGKVVHVTEVLVEDLPPGAIPAEVTIEKPAN